MSLVAKSLLVSALVVAVAVAFTTTVSTTKTAFSKVKPRESNVCLNLQPEETAGLLLTSPVLLGTAYAAAMVFKDNANITEPKVYTNNEVVSVEKKAKELLGPQAPITPAPAPAGNRKKMSQTLYDEPVKNATFEYEPAPVPQGFVPPTQSPAPARDIAVEKKSASVAAKKPMVAAVKMPDPVKDAKFEYEPAPVPQGFVPPTESPAPARDVAVEKKPASVAARKPVPVPATARMPDPVKDATFEYEPAPVPQGFVPPTLSPMPARAKTQTQVAEAAAEKKAPQPEKIETTTSKKKVVAVVLAGPTDPDPTIKRGNGRNIWRVTQRVLTPWRSQ